MNSYDSGHAAEFLARCFMRLRGYRIIAKNYVTRRGTAAGEVDFIALRGRTLAFVEVKKRQNIEAAAYAIKTGQKKRILAAAQVFLQKHPQYRGYQVRFDAILIKPPFHIKYIPGAWTA